MKKTAVCDIISPYKSARRRYTEDFKVKAFEIAEDIIGKDFINLLENTNMSKVYKMPVPLTG